MTLDLFLEQPSLLGINPVSEALSRLSHEASDDERGAIFTRREVVDFMLDLAGYEASEDLAALRLLEPCFGNGRFIMAAIQRLVASWKTRGKKADLAPCLHAVELHRDSFETTRVAILGLLAGLGFDPQEAQRLTSAWLHLGDFLLMPLPHPFDVVIGNPPYIRQEHIPKPLLAEYRQRFATLYDRADLYVPFIERSLDALAAYGQAVLICSDRWSKNKYGGPLRAKVSNGFHLRVYLDMVDTPAFETEVTAYPAITVIARGESGPTLVPQKPKIDSLHLSGLAKALRDRGNPHSDIRAVTGAVNGSEPWLFASCDKLALIRRFEASLPTLEAAGCKVGIGVATGADKAFIGPFGTLEVEPSRKLPLATTRDLDSGHVEWKGLGIVNPFEEDGSLAELSKYPKFAAYLDARRDALVNRHVAKKSPDRWYRTIDRITPWLATAPKLLIPDIKGKAQVVYEEGRLYPHHNLYFVTSNAWDLRALQAVLLSSLARAFIETYSTVMRGGFLRFQAQYLRRIRLPRWESVPTPLRLRLAEAARRLDIAECDRAVARLYGLSPSEMDLLQR